MIDEMYDRAWVGHRERFGQDVQLLFQRARAMLRPLLKPGRQSAEGRFTASVGGREPEGSAGPDA